MTLTNLFLCILYALVYSLFNYLNEYLRGVRGEQKFYCHSIFFWVHRASVGVLIFCLFVVPEITWFETKIVLFLYQTFNLYYITKLKQSTRNRYFRFAWVFLRRAASFIILLKIRRFLLPIYHYIRSDSILPRTLHLGEPEVRLRELSLFEKNNVVYLRKKGII